MITVQKTTKSKDLEKSETLANYLPAVPVLLLPHQIIQNDKMGDYDNIRDTAGVCKFM